MRRAGAGAGAGATRGAVPGAVPGAARGAGGAVLLLALLSARDAVAQSEARWARVDELLPSTLRNSLPALIRIFGDFCVLPDEPISSGELHLVEHTADGQQRYPTTAAAARLAELRPARLALYAGGWGSAPGDAAARAVVAALLSDHALVLELDTSAPRAAGYAEAALRVPELAHALAGLMLDAARAGIAPDRMHAVGFSLGAHAVGAAARTLRRAGAGTLGRLTALDPARPCFARGVTARRWRISQEDAAFVQVIHSSASTLGLARRLGHVDVYVRAGAGGGAAALARAHHAAWRLWTRSALDGGGGAEIRARRCANADALRSGACAGETVSVGYTCSSDTRGIFLLFEKNLF